MEYDRLFFVIAILKEFQYNEIKANKDVGKMYQILVVEDSVDIYESLSAILKDEGFIGSLTPVVAAEIPDEPGALNKLLDIFAKSDINLEYMYAFVGTKQGHAYMIFRVEDTKIASAALTEAGIKVVGQEELEEL